MALLFFNIWTMSVTTISIIVSLCGLILLCIFLIITEFNPCIDIVQTGHGGYKILLWYNSHTDAGIRRTYIKVFEHKKKLKV